MFRFLSNAGARVISSACKVPTLSRLPTYIGEPVLNLLSPTPAITDQVRTVIKFSMIKGTRKTVRPVLDRFFRLHWGAWIRTKAGRHKRMWAKTPANRRALREHVFCNARQSLLLDRMVSKFWRKPKYYVDDAYTPYHTREEFYITRRKPWRPEGWE